MGVVLLGVVALAGGVGAAARFVVDGWVRSRWSRTFPLATLVVNVTGSFLAGLLTGVALAHDVGPDVLAVAATGFCGGYTTFSTVMVETVRLAQVRERWWAALNALGTLVSCVAAAAGGVGLVRVLTG